MRILSAACLLALLGCGAEAGPVGPRGDQGPEGPSGPPGSSAPPGISAVDPLSIFREHEATVLISGSGTSWDAQTTVDFGPGTQTTSVVVASPAAILATVRSDSSAAVGATEITVTSAADTTTFSGAFTIESPLELVEAVGTVSPGSLFSIQVRQLDPDVPWGIPASAYIAELGIFATSVTFVSEGVLGAFFTLDLDVPPGPMTVVVRSPDPGVSPVTSRLSTPVVLPAATVTPLPLGVATGGTIDEAFGTAIFAIDAPVSSLVRVTEDNITPLTALGALLIGPDSAHALGSGSVFFAPGQARWFVAVSDLLGSAATFEVTADATAVVVTQAASGANAGAIATAGEIDLYSVVLAAGETVDLEIQDGASDVCAPTGAIDATLHLLDPIGIPLEIVGVGCPTLSFGPVAAAGTYYVRVEATGGSGATFDYSLVVTIG